MIKKTLLTAAAVLAITSGASVLQSSDAQAGYYGHGYGYGHGYHKRHCYTKWRKIKIKYWSRYHHGYHYKWVWRPYKRCY